MTALKNGLIWYIFQKVISKKQKTVLLDDLSKKVENLPKVQKNITKSKKLKIKNFQTVRFSVECPIYINFIIKIFYQLY